MELTRATVRWTFGLAFAVALVGVTAWVRASTGEPITEVTAATVAVPATRLDDATAVPPSTSERPPQSTTTTIPPSPPIRITDDPNPPWDGDEGTRPISTAPIPAGLPTLETTGVPSGVVLKDWTGPLDITEEGTVIDGYDIRGTLRIRADNVRIRNTRITSAGDSAVRIEDRRRGLVIEDSRLRGVGRCGSVVGNRDYVLRRVLITGCEDGAKAFSNVTIEDSLIANRYRWEGAHTDGIQTSQGEDIIIRRNTILGSYRGSTSAVFVKPDLDSIRDVLVEGNLLSGGSYSLYTDSAGHPATDIRIIDNIFDGGSSLHGEHLNDLESSDIEIAGNTVRYS